jgi:hypothetical protein
VLRVVPVSVEGGSVVASGNGVEPAASAAPTVAEGEGIRVAAAIVVILCVVNDKVLREDKDDGEYDSGASFLVDSNTRVPELLMLKCRDVISERPPVVALSQ